MAIDYNDKRFTDLTTEKNNSINQSNSTYDNLISQSSKYYDDLINQSKDAANKQTEIQNQQTEFAINKIEQEKAKAEKDYEKEQKGAYQDYMKQSNAYGSNMQSMGQQGLSGSGWSETIQSGFYNTYQNRYAQARESYGEIVQNYNNNITEAQLQNSSALAKIYADAQKEQLELALQSFSVIKDLTLTKQNTAMALDSEYNNRWRQVEAQINQENSLAEQIRQFNESLAQQQRQLEENKRQYESTLAFQKQQAAQEQANWAKEYNVKYGSGSSSSSIIKGSSGSSSSSIDKNGSNQVNTDYYSGSINPDTKYGVFNTTDKNGVKYQPNNVGGKKLSKSGLTIENNGVTQNVWKSSDGKYYYWEGRENKYISIPSNQIKGLQTLKNYGGGAGGGRGF